MLYSFINNTFPPISIALYHLFHSYKSRLSLENKLSNIFSRVRMHKFKSILESQWHALKQI